MNEIKPLTPFRFWAQKVIPLVYDESLSYYELLCKVIDYLNKMGVDFNELLANFIEFDEDMTGKFNDLSDQFTALSGEFADLVEFAYTNFPTYVNNKLDEMAANGTLTRLIAPYLPFITPEMFGAIGDNDTDDTEAIIDSFEAAGEIKGCLIFPAGKIYKTTEPLVVADPPDTLIMDGAIHYTGTGTALTIGKTSDNTSNLDLQLSVLGNTAGESYTAGSTGIKLINITDSFIKIKVVKRFETGVELIGENSKGFAINSFLLGQLCSCLTLLKLNSKSSGWVNENKFFGGRFQIYSTDPFKNNVIGILITSETEYYNNANIFYSPCLESMAIALKVEYGKFNKIYDARTENVTKVLDVSNDCMYNVITSSFGVTNYGDRSPSSEINLYEDGESDFLNYFRNTLFDSENIIENIASNSADISFPKLVHCYAGTPTHKIISSNNTYAEVTANGLLMKTLRTIGALFSTENNKTVLFQPIISGTFRLAVFMWDAEGNLIENNAPVGYLTKGTSKITFTLSSSGNLNHGFINGSNLNQDCLIVFPENCVKAFIGAQAFGSGSTYTLHRIVIKAREADKYYTLMNHSHAVLDAIPTSAGIIGQFVQKEEPDVTEKGWIYTSNGWIAV